VRLGLFGGSFDPIHRGHVAPVQEARRRLGLARVLYLPTAHPPHKPERRGAPALARWAMVEMALLHEDGLFASGHEMTDRASYTVETLEHFRDALPDADLHLLLGADSLASLTEWRRWRELPALARLVVLARPGWESGAVRRALPPELRAAEQAGRVVAVENEPCAASSSELRAALARGEAPAAGVLHPAVLDYARKYRLYDETTPPL
jgi:nicotinate-nucleotide adenylyltransferase